MDTARDRTNEENHLVARGSCEARPANIPPVKFPARSLLVLMVLAAGSLVGCTSSLPPDSAAIPTGTSTSPTPTATSPPSPLPTPTGPPLSPALSQAPHFLLFLGGALGDLSVTRIEGHDVDVPTSTAVVAGAPVTATDAAFAPALSRDRKRIAFVEGPPSTLQAAGEGAIVVQNIDGTGARTLVAEGGGSPSWSPDGTRIAYLQGDHRLFLMASDGSGQRAAGVDLPVNPHIAWSPDGTKLLVGSGNPSRLAVVDLAQTRATYLGPEGVQQDNPAWSPDGKQMVFSQGGANALFVANADGTGPRQLTTCLHPECSRDIEPAWSPDGTTIAFSRYAPGLATTSSGGAQQVWVIASVGGDPRQVTSGREEHSTPTW